MRINKYELLYTKYISNKNLLYNTRNYIQCLVLLYNGKESEKVYITESFCCTPETDTILQINYALIQ